MKKILFILLFFYITLFSIHKNSVYSYYKINNLEQISIQTKKTGLLLKKHVNKLEQQIKFYQEKLNLKEDKKIKKWLKDINSINKGLKAIKHDKVSPLVADILIKSIINRLKNINRELKPYLKKKLIENQKKIKYIKDKYIPIIQSFNYKLKNLLNNIIRKLQKKQNLNLKDKKIINKLKNIKKYLESLNTFYNKKFYNTKELKEFLIVNIKGIINEINGLKKELK